VLNALAASAWHGASAWITKRSPARLATFTLPPMRLEYQRIGDLTAGQRCLQRQPASLVAAVDVLRQFADRWAESAHRGDMRELGDVRRGTPSAGSENDRRSGVGAVIAIGENAGCQPDDRRGLRPGRSRPTPIRRRILPSGGLTSYLNRGDTILMKGSRMLALEKLAAGDQGLGRFSGQEGTANAAAKERSRATSAASRG